MEYKLTLGVSIEEIAKYFAWFFPSLQKHYKDYLPLVFTDPSNAPDHHAYLCPMCLKNGIVLLNGVDLRISSIFSQDHFPPQSVGGFHTMLVCKECNSNAGGLFDYSLKEQVSRMSLENRVPLSKVKAITTITDVPGNYKGTLSINQQEEVVLGFKAEGKPTAIFLNQWLQKPADDWTANISIRNPDKDKVAKALVRAAYLFCFGNWGYEFACSRSAELIRKYLAGENQYPARVPLAWIGSELRIGKETSIPIGPCQIVHPIAAKCFLVNLVLIDQETGFKEIAAVPIPNPTKSSWEDLGQMHQIFDSLILNKTPVTIGHTNKYTLKDQIHDGYARSWEYLCNL